MKIVCFPYHKHHMEPCARFAKGLARHGITAVMRDKSDQEECDVAVVWGHRMRGLFKHQLDAGKHYLVMERGYIGDRFKWTSLGFDGLNGRAKFPKIDDGMVRWNQHFAQYLKPMKKTGSDIALIMGQVAGDSSLSGVDFPQWIQDTAKLLPKIGWLPKFRPHPQDKTKKFPRGIDVLHTDTLNDALEIAGLICTWNSNSGVDALLAGNVVTANDEGSMIFGQTSWGIPKDRTAWCKKMAYTQWLPEEIESGAAWEALRTVIDG